MKPTKISVDQQQMLKKQLDDWLNQGITEFSKSSYCCPAHFVTKKNGTLRLVNNHIPINSKVRKDNYSLSHIREILVAIADMKVFSTLDLAGGFLQVPLHPDDRHIFAITTTLGLL